MTVSFRVDTKRIENALGVAPRASYFWLRAYMGGVFEDHRRTFRRATDVRFGRRAGSIKLPKLNEKPKTKEPDGFIAWRVMPEEQRQPTVRAANRGLDDLRAETFTRSEALEAHEEGSTIRPRKRRLIAVPLVAPGGKARGRRTPKVLERRLPKSSRLIALRNRSGTLILYERKRKRGPARKRKALTRSGKARATQPRVKVDTLIPRFVLTPRVELEPRLNYYEAWDKREGFRASSFSRMADRLIRGIARGDDT